MVSYMLAHVVGPRNISDENKIVLGSIQLKIPAACRALQLS